LEFCFYPTSLAELFSSVDTEAPFDAWTIDSSFDSAAECNSERMNKMRIVIPQLSEAMTKATQDFASLPNSDRTVIAYQGRHKGALCIASDDPRLQAVAVRKQWRLIAPPMIEKKSSRYLDELFDKNALLKRWQVLSSHSSEWDFDAQKELEVRRFLNTYKVKQIDRKQLELSRMDLNSKDGNELFRYIVVRDAQCIASDDPRLK
jgi:hypothetical protein